MQTGTAKTRASRSKKTFSRKPKVKRKSSKSELKRGTLDYATDVLVALITDVFNSLTIYNSADYRQDIKTIKSRIAGEGLYFVVKVLPGLADDLFNLLEQRPANFSGFKTRDGYPLFLRAAFKQAVAGDPNYIHAIYQIAVAFKKISGDYDKTVLARQYDDFVKTDRELANVFDKLSQNDLLTLERARHFATQLGKDFSLDEVVPRPGPGATNTPTRQYARYEPHVLYTEIDEVMPYAEWFYHNPWVVNESARDYLRMPRVKQPTSRFKFVPKTAMKARGICIEENEVQFFQQGIRRALTKLVARHSLYGRRITLNDQSNNGWLAKEASKDRSYATLDLSEASDRVARELVDYVFQDTPFHEYLMALSTKFIKPPPEAADKCVLKTHKFAPMGSALCFPVMSLLIMFLIRATIQLHSGQQHPHLLSTNVFVYGDDIIVPSSTYRLVCDTLTSFGMKVNESKSFVKSHFRESCGVHAYKGVDITPVFFRKTPQKKSTQSMKSIVETEHQLYENQLFNAASVLRSYAADLWPKHFRRPHYVSVESNVIGWKRRCIPFHDSIPSFKVRWNPHLQHHEIRAHVFHTRVPKVCLIHESSRILRWIAMKPESKDSRIMDDNFTRDEIVLARVKWVPGRAVFPHEPYVNDPALGSEA